MPNERDAGPLDGVVLCWTSIAPDQRGEMAAVAEQMGATNKLDLTSDVTHLIVGALDTPKYKYVARERLDIKVLAPSWLNAVRDSWLTGGDTDVAAIEDEHTLPCFAGLQICITGFDDLHERTDISDAIAANGGFYHGDLTRRVTHLIAAKAEGKKHFHAGEWGIRIVSVEWLWQSLDRGMALEESLFSLSMPPEDRGKGAITIRQPPSPLGKRPRDSASAADSKLNTRRKLRRTASMKLESQNDDLWADIGSGDTAAAQPGGAEWDEQPDVKPEMSPNTLDDSLTASATALELSAPENSTTSNARQDQVSTIFRNRKVCTYGFRANQVPKLQDHLSSNGAIIVDKEGLSEHVNRGFDVTVVVPHNAPKKILEHIRSLGGKTSFTVASEWWVERCIHTKACVQPDTPWTTPLQQFPVLGFEKLTICPTSFKGVDLLHLSKVVPLLGAKYDENLRPDTSVLVCSQDKPNPQKVRYAVSHDIPVVGGSWLWTSVERGELLPFEQFLLIGSRKRALEPNPAARPPPHPLQELDPSTNSRSRPGTSRSGSESLETAMRDKVPKTTRETIQVAESRVFDKSEDGEKADPKAINDALASLLAQKKDTTDNNRPASRRQRTLGRATSNPSSVGASTENQTPLLDDEGDEEDEAHPKRRAPFFSFQPSQAISYEVEDAMAARERFRMRTGVGGVDGTDEGGMKRVESIGVVKDAAVGAAGGSGAVEGKRRGGRRR